MKIGKRIGHFQTSTLRKKLAELFEREDASERLDRMKVMPPRLTSKESK